MVREQLVSGDCLGGGSSAFALTLTFGSIFFVLGNRKSCGLRELLFLLALTSRWVLVLGQVGQGSRLET